MPASSPRSRSISRKRSRTTWKGALTVQDGKLTMYLNDQCNGGGPGLLVGEAWPASNNWTYPCVQTRVYWKKVQGQCRISALRVVELKEPMMDPAPPIILASLSHPSEPAEFQMWPALIASGMPCGCPPDLPDCCDPDPGQYELDFDDNVVIDSTLEKTFPRFGSVYRLKNIQSYIGAGCQNDPGSDVHIDWFLERLPP